MSTDEQPIDFDPQSGDVEVVTPAEQPSQRVTLQQFCDHFTTCLPTMLGGWKYRERQAGNLHDTVENYSARLAKFHYQPLG
jgi:hypothetical protein